jgi:hypothetical protein
MFKNSGYAKYEQLPDTFLFFLFICLLRARQAKVFLGLHRWGFANAPTFSRFLYKKSISAHQVNFNISTDKQSKTFSEWLINPMPGIL